MVTSLFRWVLRQAVAVGAATLHETITVFWSLIRHRTSSSWATFNELAFPSGWREVQVSPAALDRFFSPKSFFGLYGLAFLIVPPVMAFWFVTYLNSSEPVARAQVTAVLGYNALFVASAVTAAAVLTGIASATLRRLSILKFRLDYIGMLKVVAAWMGGSSAAGAIGAALVPLLQLLLPVLPTTGISSHVPVITPQVLLDLPAAGAVIGYVLGVAAALLKLGTGASNLVFRRLLIPALFVLSTWVLVGLGVTPMGLFRSLVVKPMNTVATVACDVPDPWPQFSAHVDEPAWMLVAVDRCGGGTMLSGEALGISVSVLVVIGIAWTVVRDLLSRSATGSGQRTT
ncbi:MAG: hypothetical protein WBA87_11245 [Microbacterium sp.]